MINEYTIKRPRWQRTLLHGFRVLWWLIVPLMLAGTVTCTHYNCTAEDETRTILERDGYKVIEVGNHAWLRCGRDAFSSTFVAERNGERVEGAVCCGLVKNCTVRWK